MDSHVSVGCLTPRTSTEEPLLHTGSKHGLQELVDEINNLFCGEKVPVLGELSKNYLMEIIWSGDFESLETIYTSVSEKARSGFHHITIMKETFPKLESLDFKPELLKDCYFQSLPILAATFNANSIVNFFCKEFPSEVLQTADVGKANIIHALIFGSYLKIKDEKDYVMLFQEIMEVYPALVQKESLLYGETTDGLRPLELASKLGQYRLVAAIAETPGVYKIGESQTGPFRKVHYNMSDYTFSGSRCHRSPLRDLLTSTNKELTAISDTGFMQIPLFKTWEQQTYRRYRPSIIAWIIYRVLVICMAVIAANASDKFFLFIDYFLRTFDFEMILLRWIPNNITKYAKNATTLLHDGFISIPTTKKHADVLTCQYLKMNLGQFGSPSEGMNLVSVELILPVFVMCLLILGFDICDVIIWIVQNVIDRRMNRKFAKKGSYIVDNTFYRISTTLMAFGYLVFFGQAIALHFGTLQDPTMFSYLSSFTVPLFGIAKVVTSWSVLYFLQLSPGLGCFVIGFQRMMMALFQFLCVFGIIFISFSDAFTDILGLDCTKQGFSNPTAGFYHTFLMMVNMVTLSEYNISTIYVVKMLHVAFIIIVTILLVNFLIALMSNKHTEMTEYGDLIFRLYRLDVAMTVERRLAKLCRCCCRRREQNDGIIVVTIIN